MYFNKLLLFVLFLISIHIKASGIPSWGDTGHRTVGAIAQKHLTNKTQRQINKLLQGESLAFVSTFADEIKSDPRFKKFSSWHYVNFPFGTKYENSDKNKIVDIVTGIENCIAVLKSRDSNKEDKTFYLKFLVHLIGDLHQPLHIGKAEDKGGNNIQVRWHNKGSNLHRVWDSDMIRSWNMSYSELAKNARNLSQEQISSIERGTILDWVYESQKLAIQIYKSANKGEKLGYKYSYEHFGTVRSQLQKAGIRLAKILNEIFG